MKIIKRFCCIALFAISIIGLSSCNQSNNEIIETDTTDELVDELVQLALDDADLRLDNYIDVDYFINLQSSTKEMVDSVQNLSLAVINNNEESMDIDEEQYLAFTKSVTNIFEDLNNEEYEAFKTLAEEDTEIAEMLDMIENGFYNENEESLSQSLMAANVVKLCNATSGIGNLLASQGVCASVISCIKGAYNAMIGFVKAFFLPTWAKVAGITACILVITTIVVINWDKIKPVFTQMANYFIDSAKKLASTVTKVFNDIFQLAMEATSYGSFDDVVDKDNSINQRLKNTGKTLTQLKFVLASFLGVQSLSTFYNSDNKVLCIGKDIEDTYSNKNDLRGYQNYAKKYNYWSFWLEDYKDYLDKYTKPFLDICNDVLIYYCCYNDWDFILVTNPYHYMAEHLDTRYGGNAYATEISIIRSNGYNNFTNVSLSWNTIPNPGYLKENYFSYAGYRVSR